VRELKLKDLFQIRKDLTFLNFGSFGATPLPIFEAYQNFQKELEEDPVQFITEKSPKYIQQSRIALSQFLNCQEEDIVLVSNPSYAVNIIAKSLNLQPNDEVLTTNLEYGACDKTWNYYCKKSGAKYIQHPILFPIEDKASFVEQFMKGVTAKTKLIFISHITSSTALRLPVEEICIQAKKLGILTFVDGAHGPGQVQIDLKNSDIDIYTGACHKWMMAPKGTSFLYVKKELQHLFDPLLISWGYDSAFPSNSQFLDYHETQGTRDTSAFCTIPACIEFMEKYDWKSVSEKSRKLVQDNAQELCNILGKQPLAPIESDFIQQMFSCEIDTKQPQQLHDLLYKKYNIQIPVMAHGDKCYIRYSINGFNEQEDLDKLFAALKEIKKY
jgi:isopenicillin-N epimerase